MKKCTITFKTFQKAIEYKEKIKDNYSNIRIIHTGLLHNEYKEQPIKNKFQVRAFNY